MINVKVLISKSFQPGEGPNRGLLLLIVNLQFSQRFVSSSNSNGEEMRGQQTVSPRQDSSGRGPPPPHTSAASSRRGVGPRVDIDIEVDIDIDRYR